uniref:Uncharacterized protein n=1 Tax=Eucampia zodiacus TaxID=444606 RepID=A0A7T0CRT2_9STRA|nr:hypothetical protein J6725_mgp20 [Eucampia zodiacus]QPJ79914.1 hypothetical protein [Eucampia zodiacus]
MWILIAGNLMCIFISTLIYKISIINNLTFLYSNEKIIGWFLIGYIPETYYNLSVKFFLINNEFRQLITNFLLVIKNVLSLSYLITFVEFINLILTELFLIFLLFLHIKFLMQNFNNLKIKNKKNIFFFTTIFLFFLTFLNDLKTYSFKFFSIPVLFILNYFFNYIILQYFLIVILLTYLFSILYTKYRYYKTLFLFFQFYIVIFLTYYIHTFEIEYTNNFLNENFLKLLYLYVYLFII